MSFAKAVLSGVVISEPEKRFTPNNHAVTSFTLSVEGGGGIPRAGGNEPFEVKVTCWRNLADAVAAQLQKGDSVLVEGKLIINSFQTQDGSQKKQFEVEAVSVDKLAGPSSPILPTPGVASGMQTATAPTAPSATGPWPVAPSTPQASPAAPSYTGGGHFSSEDLLTEDDIPF